MTAAGETLRGARLFTSSSQRRVSAMSDHNPDLPPDARSETTRIRQGKTLGVMRWVLLISLSAAIAALLVVFAASA